TKPVVGHLFGFIFGPGCEGGRRRGLLDPLAVGAAVARHLEVPGRQVDGEYRALAHRAVELDLAAEQVDELTADREAQAGAAVLAAGRAVGLLKGLEDHPLLVVRDADAGVADVERDHRAGP